MRNHKKTYEDVFSTDHKGNRNSIKIENVTTDMGVGEYIKLFQGFLKSFYDDLFLQCVKLSWLRRKFEYCGQKPQIPMYTSPRILQGKFVKFMRRYIGNDIQMINRQFFFNKLEANYFNELFPGFDEGNPFENPDYYKFPYKNISLDYLMFVYQLDDRFELLKEADKQKMTYAVFLDYVLNHVFNENEFLGRERYTFAQNNFTRFPLFIKDTEKNIYVKRKKK